MSAPAGGGPRIRERSAPRAGQMTVELAALIPVALAVALVGYNVAQFCALCASFDRIAYDMVIAQGVAPSGDQNAPTALAQVKEGIEQAMGNARVEVDVSADSLSSTPARGRGLGVPVSPFLTAFTCTLRYRPWPQISDVAGVGLGLPVTVTHQRTLVVDRFRAGVVV